MHTKIDEFISFFKYCYDNLKGKTSKDEFSFNEKWEIIFDLKIEK